LIVKVKHFGEIIGVTIDVASQRVVLEGVIEEEERAVVAVELATQLGFVAFVVGGWKEWLCGVLQCGGNIVFGTRKGHYGCQ
jgi:hypothetical protein